jgi:stage V sporulation protein G
MNITNVKIVKANNQEKLKAYVSITIDDALVVKDIKIIAGSNGLFISMPSKKDKNGEYRDIVHPVNKDSRAELEKAIFDEYHKQEGSNQAHD